MKKKVLAFFLALTMIAALLPAIIPAASAADTDAFGLPLDNSWTAPPLENNPYGTTGWVTLFSVNEFYMAKGSGSTRTATVRDTTPNFEPITGLYNDGIMNIGTQYGTTATDATDASNISFAASVAFDPTGSGQKKYVANIGFDRDGYMTLWVTNDTGSTVASCKIQTGASSNYAHMKELSGYNYDGYLQITAGDYNGDGKETIMVYDPAMPKPGDNANDIRPRVREYSFSGADLTASGQVFDPGSRLSTNGHYNDVIKEHSNDHNRLRTTPTAHLVSGDTDKDGRDELVATYSFQNIPNASYGGETITERAVVAVIYELPSTGSAWQGQSFVMQDTGTSANANRIRTSGAAAIGNFAPTERSSNWPQIVVAGTWDSKGGATSSTTGGKWGYGVIYCNSVNASGIGTYNLEGLSQVDQNGFTKGGIYTDDTVKPLAPIVAFNASGAANAASLFLSGTVYSVSSGELTEQWTNKYFKDDDDGLGSYIISNAHIIKPVAGNFDGNKEGREQVVFIALYKRQSYNTYFWRLFTAGSASTDADGNGDWKLATKGGVSSSGGLSNKSGNFEIYAKSADEGKNWISIAALDTKEDANLGKIKSITREYTSPAVLTIFESAPYFADLDSIESGYYTAGGTYYGKSKGSGSSSSASHSLKTNIIFGYEYEDPITNSGIDIEATISNNFTWETETSYELEFGIGYTSTPGQHSVLLYRIPVVLYEYDGLSADGKGGYEETTFVLGMQQTPVTGLISVDAYNKAAPSMDLDIIDDSVISSTPGEPSTYRRSTLGLDKLMIDSDKTPNPFSSYGVTEMTIDRSSSSTNTFKYEFGFDLKIVGKVAGVKFGGSLGYGYTNGSSTMDFEGISMGGAVAGQPAGAEEYNFNWLFASWATQINGQEVPVLGYIVSGYSAPPSAPINLSIHDVKSDSLTLQWEHGLSGAEKYAIYRYVENDPIPERLLAIVSSANTEYLFNNDVTPETTYSFVIRAISSLGTSVRSPVATATTLPAGAGTMNVAGPADVSVNVGGSAAFEVSVTGIPKEYLSTQYQWERRTSGTNWEKVGGVSSSPKITVTNVTQEMDDYQYRCIVLATKGDGSIVYFYSRIATLNVGLADSNAVLTLTGAQGGDGTTRDEPYYGNAAYQEANVTTRTVTENAPVTVTHSGISLSVYQVVKTRDTSGEPTAYEDYYIGIGYDGNNVAKYYKVTKGTAADFSNAVFVEWTVKSSHYIDDAGNELYDREPDTFITEKDGVEYDTYLQITGGWNDAMPSNYDFTGVGLLSSATGYTVYYGRFAEQNDSASYTYYDSAFNPATLSADVIAGLYTVFDKAETSGEETTSSQDDPPVVTVTETTTTTWMIGRQEGYDFEVAGEGQYTGSFFQAYQLIKTHTAITVDSDPPSLDTGYAVTPAYYENVNEFTDENNAGTGKTTSDLTSLMTATQRTVEETSYTSKEGDAINFAATIKDAASGSTISGTNVAFTITNTRTGVVSTVNAVTGTNGTASITAWRAPTAGLYSIVATSTQTSLNKLAQSTPLYYLATPNEDTQYVLQLTNSAGESVNTITYGSSVALAVGEYTTASGVKLESYTGPAYYKIEYVDYNSVVQSITVTGSSFTPPQAGGFVIVALDAPDGNILATTALTVLRRSITIGVTDVIPDTKPAPIVKSGSLVGSDAYDFSSFIDVSCGLFNDATGARYDTTGTFPVAIFYKTSLGAAVSQKKTEMLAKYSVTLDQSTTYAVMPDQISVYYTSGENGSVIGRQTDANLKFSSGAAIEVGTRLMFEASVNSGFGVKEWSINGNAITESTAAYTLSADRTVLTINKVTAADAQSGVITVNVAFNSANCLINFGAGSGGGVSAITATSGNTLTTGTRVTNGTTVILTAVPDGENVVDTWTVNDETVYWPGTNIPYREKTLEIENVQIDYNVNVSFKADNKHSVTTSAYNEDGNPSSSVRISAKAYNGDSIDLASVSDGTSIVFTADNLIADNQIVKKWQVKKEGSTVFSDISGSGGRASCVYYSVDSDFEIRAIVGTSQEFNLSYSIVDNNGAQVTGAAITAASAGSTLSPGYNTGFISVEFTASYDDYSYQVYNWVLNGIEQNITDDVLVLDALDSHTTVTAILIKKPVVTVSTTTNGVIYDEDGPTSISGTTYTIPYGMADPMKFIVTPDYGYEVNQFSVGGTVLTGTPVSGDTLEFTYTPPTGGVVSDISVVATFAAIPTFEIEYAVFNAGSGYNGEIGVEVSRKNMTSYAQTIAKSGSGSITVFRDSEVSFTSVADTGYVLQNWIINDTNANISTQVLTKTITDGSVEKVEAQFTSQYGKLLFGTDGNGSVGAAIAGTSTSIDNGANIENTINAVFTATPNYGYQLLYWEVDGEIENDTFNPLTKQVTTAGMNVIAHFEGESHTITYSAEGGGTISAFSGAVPVDSNAVMKFGESIQFIAAPDVNYVFDGFYLDGTKVTDGASGMTYTSAVSGDMNVVAKFLPGDNTIIYSPGTGGSVSATLEGVNFTTGEAAKTGQQITFTAIPDTGYKVNCWKVNDMVVSGEKGNTFTLTAAGDATVNVVFIKTQFEVIFGVSGAANGGISAMVDGNAIQSGDTVATDKTVIFTATPNGGYMPDAWTIGGVSQTTDTVTQEVIITSDAEVMVSFKEIPSYTLTFSSTGKGAGTIKVNDGDPISSGSMSVKKYDTVTFVAIPDNEYNSFSKWYVNDMEQAEGSNTLTIDGFGADTTVEAEFVVLVSYDVAFSAGTGGAISAKANGVEITHPAGGAVKVPGNSKIVFTAAPESGMVVSGWKVNGVIQKGNLSNVFTVDALSGNITVEVEFKTYDAAAYISLTTICDPDEVSVDVTSLPDPQNPDSKIAVGHELKVEIAPKDSYIISTFVMETNTGTTTVNVNAGGSLSVSEGGDSGVLSHLTYNIQNGELVYYVDSVPNEGDITITITAVSGYTLTITPGGNGTISASINGAAITSGSIVKADTQVALTATPNTGYKFSSWSKDGEGTFTTNTANTIFIMPSGAVTISASFTSSDGGSPSTTYTVTFQSNGGTAVNSQSIAENGKVAKPVNPVLNDYTFTGWYTESSCETLWDFDTGTVTKNLTLYAGWSTEIEDPDTPLGGLAHSAYIFGYPDGSFGPDKSITRAEAAMLFFRLLDEEDAAPAVSQSAILFPDVSESAWYYEAVTRLADIGVITGYPDGSFGPDKTITRAEFTAMAIRFAELEEKSGATGFPDVSESNWAAGYIAAAVEKGYITGYPDGSFGPENQITRAEAVTILNRIRGCDGLSEGTSFTDVPKSHWAYEAITAAATGHEHE